MEGLGDLVMSGDVR